MESGVKIDEAEIMVMNLTHYFITEENYNPIIIHGLNDEIWLENMNSNVKIIRIVSRYIHNNEQFSFNKYRADQIIRKLRWKTLSLKMTVVSIYINLGDNVTDFENKKNNLSFGIKKISDIKKNKELMEIFPNIVKGTSHLNKGINFLFKVTDDINRHNIRRNENMDKIFREKKKIVTYVIMGLCILMFIVSGYGYSTIDLIKYGANYGELVKSGEWYRLITYMFLHGGFVHIICNMYSLYVIGPRVEDFFGKWKYIVIYLLSGISGGLLSIAMNPNVVSVGASGAIFGLFGALIYFSYNYRGYIASIIKSQIVPIVIYNLLIGFFMSGIDMWGHVGGLIGGILVSYMLGTIENKKYSVSNIMVVVMYFGFLIYLALFR